MVYFAGYVLFCFTRSERLKALLSKIFPLVFGLGIFLTVGYYVVILHALTVPIGESGLSVMRSRDIFTWVTGYGTFYVALINLNFYITGAWMYPIIEDMGRLGGSAGKAAFFSAVVGSITLFAFVGARIATAKSVKVFSSICP